MSLRVNMIMCSGGPVSRFFFDKWFRLYKRAGFHWRFLDFHTGFDYGDGGIEVEEIEARTHGLCLNRLYAAREYPIEVFCDLDSFPVAADWPEWIGRALSRFSLVAAEDWGPIRDYPGKAAPSFMAFSPKAPASLDFTCKKRSHDTAHLILRGYPEGGYRLLRQVPSGFGVGTFYCQDGVKIWYHQWYLRKENPEHIRDAEAFFRFLEG